MRVDLKNEFRHALIDGLGKEIASTYQFSMVLGKSMAIALSEHERKVLLLILDSQGDANFSRFDYLEKALVISRTFDCFAVPAQKVEPRTLWGGRTQGPVIVYPFKVIECPMKWSEKWPDHFSLD